VNRIFYYSLSKGDAADVHIPCTYSRNFQSSTSTVPDRKCAFSLQKSQG
jgi:hypothetical protein